MRTVVLVLLSVVTLGAQGWTQLTNTQLQTVCPPTNFQPPGNGMPTYDFYGNCPTVIDAWSGGVADTKRNRLIIFGGGHAGYLGNEVYALDLVTKSTSTGTSCLGVSGTCSTNAGVPTMTRLNNPSIFVSLPPYSGGNLLLPNVDGTPWSEHTYGSQVYFPKADKVSLWLGSTPDGSGDQKLWLLNLSTMTWANSGFTQAGPGGAINGRGAYCTLDPTQSDESMICIIDGNGTGNIDLVRYDIVTNVVTRLIAYNTYQWQIAPTVIVDPDRKLLFAIGNNSSPGTGKIYVTDLTDPSYTRYDWTSTVTNCANLMGDSYPGVAWDPTLHKIVGYTFRNSGTTTASNNVTIFDPATKTCTTQPIPSGGGTGPTPDTILLNNDRGMYGRFSYFPALGKYVVVNNAAGDAYTFALNTTPTNGLGSSTLTCVDRDGDGYGTGLGCLGPDADDQDIAVHTASQMCLKWGGNATCTNTYILLSLQHLGYNPTNIWYISPTGNDGTGAVNNLSLPFATCCGSGKANPSPGDAVLLRGGDFSGNYWNFVGGSVGLPIIYMAYPGEKPQWTTTGNMFFNTLSYIIVDGLVNSGAMSNNACLNSANSNLAAFRHIEASNCKWGMNATNNNTGALYDFTVEDSIFHDNWSLGCGTAEHGVYFSNHQDQVTHQTATLDYDIFFRRNIVYRNCRNGLQVNGRFNNLVAEQNVIYNNDQGGFALYSGVANSTVRSNLVFGNASSGIAIFGYPSFCNAYDSTGTNTCPANQNNNLIENNTFYSTGIDPKDGSSDTSAAVIEVTAYAGLSTIVTNPPTYVSGGSGGTPGTQTVTFTNGGCISTGGTMTVNGSGVPTGAVTVVDNISELCTSVPTQGTVTTVTGTVTFTGGELTNMGMDFGHNTIRNNILNSYSNGGAGGFGVPPIYYSDVIYPTTSTFQNNLFYSLMPTAGTFTNVISTKTGGVYTYYTCAAATALSGSTFGSFGNCQNVDPLFTTASPSYWNTPASFNFQLQTLSPALSVGSVTMLPSYDLVGTINPVINPSLGAYESLIISCSLSPTSLGPYTNGQVVSQTFTPTGCGSSTCSISAGSLSGSGLTLGGTQNCVLSGTAVTGSYGFTVTYDTAGNAITLGVNVAPTITTVSLPAVTQGSAYSQTLVTSGGTGAVTCALFSGSLTGSGITLNSNCTLTGTAGTPATYTFTAKATDTNSITGAASASLGITVGGNNGKSVSGGKITIGGRIKR
jgi:Right handed beta helix region